MPALVPRPVYEPRTPEVDDFCNRLADGLTLTLDETARRRAGFLEQAAAVQPEIDAAKPMAEAARLADAQARSEFEALEAQPTPRHGFQGLRNAARVARLALAEAEAVAEGLRILQGRALREAELRDGSTQPRVQWQYGDRKVGPAKFGVYAFYDYDGHAMYVGKTTEGLSVRVGRHLTNQRTDAVGMSVLDPLEVVEVEVWPLWPNADDPDDRAAASTYIDRLEFAVEKRCIDSGSVLFNEKRIAEVANPPELPASVRFDVLSSDFRARLGHPDLRIARRLAIAARLGSRIAERSLRNIGLRQSLQRQLARLQELADARFLELGGEAKVPLDDGKDDDDE